MKPSFVERVRLFSGNLTINVFSHKPSRSPFLTDALALRSCCRGMSPNTASAGINCNALIHIDNFLPDNSLSRFDCIIADHQTQKKSACAEGDADFSYSKPYCACSLSLCHGGFVECRDHGRSSGSRFILRASSRFFRPVTSCPSSSLTAAGPRGIRTPLPY